MTPDLTLVRVSIRKDGAFGVLLEGDAGGRPICVTIERSYDSDQGQQLVKIPAGLWRCTRTVFHGGKPVPYETLEIHVPGHSRLLFHKAAVEAHLDGCVGLGLGLVPDQPVLTISGSVPAFAAFWKVAERLLAQKPELWLAVKA